MVIGGWGNTLSAIKNVVGGENLAEAAIDGLCNCNEWRPFWVSENSFDLGRALSYHLGDKPLGYVFR